MKGIVNILKPPHMTSHDVVYFIKKRLNIKKVGHTGTLDPMAAGVLPICIGEATKISQYLLNDTKKYRCEMTLGKNTDTQDQWGEVIKKRPVKVSKEEIIKAFLSFKGEIKQIPPMYSALKHKGKKLYELAREGKEVEREARKVMIYELDIINIDENNILFDVLCSKGTYVRTLCEDIGNLLGCGAYMSFLLRTQSGKFDLNHSISLEELENMSLDEIKAKILLPLDEPLKHLPRIDIREESKKYLMNGNDLYMKNILSYDSLSSDEMIRLYVENKFVGLGTIEKEPNFYIRVHRVFN